MKRTAFSLHNELYVQYLKSENKHNMSVQHYHDTYEIYLQLSGKRYLFYDNTCYTLERGDLRRTKVHSMLINTICRQKKLRNVQAFLYQYSVRECLKAYTTNHREHLEKIKDTVRKYAELEGLAEDEVKDQEGFHGDISLATSETAKTLKNPKSLKTAGFMPEEDVLLEEIISKINERFDGVFSEGDRVIVETLYNRAKENKKLNRQAQKNDEEVYTKSIFPEVFKQVAQDCYIEQMKAFSKLFEDKRFYDTVMATLAQETYRHSNDCAL